MPFNFLPTFQPSNTPNTPNTPNTQQRQDQRPRYSVEEIKKHRKAAANSERFEELKQFWGRASFNEIGLIRTEKLNIRIYPHGCRGDQTIAKIQYQTIAEICGDEEFSYSAQWHDIGYLSNRNGRILFFLDKSSDSLAIGKLTIIKTHLKEYGLVHTDNLKATGCKGLHPFLDTRLMQLLRIWIISGPIESKPFQLTRDTRQTDPCQKMKPLESVSTQKYDSGKSRRYKKMAENRIAVLEKQNRELLRSLNMVKPDDVEIDSDSGQIVDSWFKVLSDRDLLHNR